VVRLAARTLALLRRRHHERRHHPGGATNDKTDPLTDVPTEAEQRARQALKELRNASQVRKEAVRGYMRLCDIVDSTMFECFGALTYGVAQPVDTQQQALGVLAACLDAQGVLAEAENDMTHKYHDRLSAMGCLGSSKGA